MHPTRGQAAHPRPKGQAGGILNDSTMGDTAAAISAIITALGGIELIKYIASRKSRKRTEQAQADRDDLHLLRETIEFLQEQLKQKEERFAEQTNLVRTLNAEVIELTRARARAEMELAMYRCVVKKCGNREPQNGY